MTDIKKKKSASALGQQEEESIMQVRE